MEALIETFPLDEPMVNPLREEARITFAELAREVANKYKVSVQELKGERRNRPAIDARLELYYRCYVELPQLSTVSIGRLVGGRDHSTVIKAVQRYCEKIGVPYPPKTR